MRVPSSGGVAPQHTRMSTQEATMAASSIDPEQFRALKARIDELEDETEELREELAEEKKQREHVAQQIPALRQTFSELVGWDVYDDRDLIDAAADMFDRIEAIEEQSDEHASKIGLFAMTDGGSERKPDERAMLLRHNLYTQAKASSNGRAALDKDSANAALGGDLSRAQSMDAMRRAADGTQAENINGASSLDAVDGITFQKRTEKKSRVMIDVSDITDWDARNNITTDSTSEGV